MAYKEKKFNKDNEKFYFTQPENAVMFDKEISSTAKVVYCAILKYANVKTRQCALFLKTLAQEVGRSIRTIQRALKQLIEKGFIIRTERYGIDGGNIASNFEVITQSGKREGVTQVTPNGDNNDGQNNNILYNDIITLKGEAELPNPDGNFNSDVQEQAHEPETDVPTLDNVPDIMRPTARYLLQRTGRKSLEKDEIPLLQVLSSRHMPSRVQKEIDKACERFIAKGKDLITLSFRYIAACLKNQKSFTPSEKPAKEKNLVAEAYETYGALITELTNSIIGGATA